MSHNPPLEEIAQATRAFVRALAPERPRRVEAAVAGPAGMPLLCAVERALAEALPGKAAQELVQLLTDYLFSGENPPPPQAHRVCEQAAMIARRFVDEAERERVGYDRLGQCVRNLFECLERGEEGAELGLRAGENPRSLQRPV